MIYKVIPTPLFQKQAKRLSKKLPSLKDKLSVISNSLERSPNQGIPLGHNAYKIRLAVKSKGKGKSGGMRIITYVVTDAQEIFLLTIYDKSEMDTIDDKTLRQLIRDCQP